ncbi:uncharacterized protein LOC113287099 [Papaver somniferum]|uniref:uncharacterized protein LOC113287099 n=1 Tax=Papaver somniferum TaxID=3469 RepID=UPI000E700472|nr:uncharacterized protein LOC113287099 [Papaver somniferum]
MSISKFAVNYRRKDDKDHGYGNNLRKKMKNQKIEEEVEVEGRSNVKKKKMKTEEKDDKGHGSNLSKKTKNQKIEEKVEARSNLKKKTKTEKKKEKDEIEMIQISLPIELILEFLSRLPVKSLTRLSCTKIRSPNSGLLRTCASAVFTSYGAAGAGGGALFWWTTDPQVILLFDLHENKLQYIRIPLERDTHTRRFEHKGFLVVARLEKKSPTTLTLGKVHLKILKAYKDDQVWAEETIDLSAYSIPFSSTFRFMSFSDQILLYWVDAKNFHFFNLQKRCLKVVRNLDSCISEKMLPTVVRPYDYWLNCEVENICALRTLLPARAQISDRAALNSMMKKNFENMWTLQQPKTVGGIFSSYYKSKTNSHYFFDD